MRDVHIPTFCAPSTGAPHTTAYWDHTPRCGCQERAEPGSKVVICLLRLSICPGVELDSVEALGSSCCPHAFPVFEHRACSSAGVPSGGDIDHDDDDEADDQDIDCAEAAVEDLMDNEHPATAELTRLKEEIGSMSVRHVHSGKEPEVRPDRACVTCMHPPWMHR